MTSITRGGAEPVKNGGVREKSSQISRPVSSACTTVGTEISPTRATHIMIISKALENFIVMLLSP
jgi:hypothetical protein